MRLRVPVIVKDPEVSDFKEIAPTETITIESEDMFLDGPISPRVAILDLDPATGRLRPGVRVRAPKDPRGYAGYDLPTPVRADSDVSAEAAAVSTFGCVHKTLKLFEEEDALGRRVQWAFDAPQLLVVPRAGEWANAFYERESRSLQFFFFKAGGRTIHTCHSQDIVAHETAHAILDGVVPDLYDAITPQSLAIHEAVADLAAVLCSFRCRELSQRVLAQTGGSIRRSTAFSGIGEQFAGALNEQRNYLRDLDNDRRLQDLTDRADPHDLSVVLSGALYRMLVNLHEQLRQEYATRSRPPAKSIVPAEESYVQQNVLKHPHEDAPPTDIGPSLKALFVAADRTKRTVFRGLDYLPPGDVSFADLGRAILAADEASHPDSDQPREWLREELTKRGIFAGDGGRPGTPVREAIAVDLEALVQSDYVAYDFVNKNRGWLGIPANGTFDVPPRLDVTKLEWHRGGQRKRRECILKVRWTDIEPSALGRSMPSTRRVTAGTTLAVDWETRTVRALLKRERTSEDRRDTETFLRRMVDSETLRLGEDAKGPGGRPLRGVIRGDALEGALRVRGTARMLHVTREARS
jgi:hypothetical protein